MNASAIRFTDRAVEALGSVRTLIVPTDIDESGDGAGCVDVARHAAAAAAGESPLTVVLYDRSGETWMDHPHPNGPHRRVDLSDEHAELAAQMHELELAGVDTQAWISTVPALTDVVTAIQQIDADALLLPEQLCDRTLMDRLTGGGDTNDEVAATIDRQLDRAVTVFSVADDTVDLLTVTSPDAARR